MNLASFRVSRLDTPDAAALVAESEAAPRDMLCRILRQVGYRILVAADASQLEAALRHRDLRAASNPLAILRVDFAARCAATLRGLGAQRVHCELTEPNVILTYERFTLNAIAKPSLVPCNVMAGVERPFDLEELKSLARTARSNAVPPAAALF